MRESYRLMKRQAANLRELAREMERDLAYCEGRMARDTGEANASALEQVTARYLRFVEVCGYLCASVKSAGAQATAYACELEAFLVDEGVE